MFAIYTSEGRTFSGSLERMRRVEKSAAANTTRPAADAKITETDDEPVAPYTISQKATDQYRSMLQQEAQREPVYHAYQIMSAKVQLLHGDWSLSRALEQFRRHPYQLLPVVNDRRALMGTLSRKQLYEFLLEPDKNNATGAINKVTKSIRECFFDKNTKAYAADPVTDIRRIATLLVEKNLDAMPVVEETGRIVGIVSRTDILQCAISDPPLSLWC